MFNKKRTSLLPVRMISVISKYVNHHSSCSTCTAAENFNVTSNYVQKWLSYYGTRKIRSSCAVTTNGFKVIKSIANMLLKLPEKKVMETIRENELCTRYLDPVLSGLLDKPEHRKFFRWKNERTNVSKASGDLLSSNRPGAVISCLDGVKWTLNQGFGEAKCSSEADNNYLTSIDLVRLGMFSKQSIEAQQLKGVLSLQAIGNNVTFYITTHTHDNMYIMFEIAEIIAPCCIDDILKYLMDFSKLVAVVDVYSRWCVEKASNHDSHPLSPNMAKICALISPTTGRSRPCITK